MNSVEKTISKFLHNNLSPSPGQDLHRKMRVVRASLAVTDTSTGRACWYHSQPADTLHVQMKASQPELTPSLPTHPSHTAGHQSFTHFNSWEQVSSHTFLSPQLLSSDQVHQLSWVSTDSLSCFNLKEKRRAQGNGHHTLWPWQEGIWVMLSRQTWPLWSQ